MSSIITVKIENIKDHPNATKLKICDVKDGNQVIQVVCGAQNVRVGMITVLAQVDSTTPSGLNIKTSDLRGIASHGMLCSAKDLGINDETGIVDLPPTTKLGQDYSLIEKSYLSSTPWFDYKEVEAFWEDELGRIWVYRDGVKPSKNDGYNLISKTYFHENNYIHRNFI